MAIRVFLASLAACVLSTSVARAQQAEAFQATTVYTVKQQGGGLGIFIDQIVVFQQVKRRGEKVWVAERRRHEQRLRERTFQHQWIDGRACKALSEVLDKIGQLPPRRFAGPTERERGWISDTPHVTLIGPAAGGFSGAALMQRDVGGDLSRWWSESEKALASCWQDGLVLVGDGTVGPKLDTDDRAAAAGRP